MFKEAIGILVEGGNKTIGLFLLVVILIIAAPIFSILAVLVGNHELMSNFSDIILKIVLFVIAGIGTLIAWALGTKFIRI